MADNVGNKGGITMVQIMKDVTNRLNRTGSRCKMVIIETIIITTELMSKVECSKIKMVEGDGSKGGIQSVIIIKEFMKRSNRTGKTVAITTSTAMVIEDQTTTVIEDQTTMVIEDQTTINFKMGKDCSKVVDGLKMAKEDDDKKKDGTHWETTTREFMKKDRTTGNKFDQINVTTIKETIGKDAETEFKNTS